MVWHLEQVSLLEGKVEGEGTVDTAMLDVSSPSDAVILIYAPGWQKPSVMLRAGVWQNRTWGRKYFWPGVLKEDTWQVAVLEGGTALAAPGH